MNKITIDIKQDITLARIESGENVCYHCASRENTFINVFDTRYCLECFNILYPNSFIFCVEDVK